MKSSKKIISLFLTLFVLLTAIALSACGEEGYTVSFDSVGGSNVDSVIVMPGEKVTAPTAPTKDGYVFMGWYNGTTVWNFETDTVESDMTLIAKWTSSVDADAVTVTFDSKGGSTVDPVTVGRGVYVGAPTTPAKPGYTFDGWYYNNEVFNFENTVVVKDMTLIAKWSLDTYVISYNTAGGQNTESNPTSYDVNCADIGIAYPTRVGYDFVGWVWEGQAEPVKDFVIKSGSTGHIILTACWQKTTYPLAYNLNGGIAGAEYPASYDVETASFAIANPTRDYYEFIGWTYEGQQEPKRDLTIEKGTVGSKTLVANWRAIEYTINYELSGGENNPENPASYNVASGIVTIKAPSRMGYIFKGWLYEGIEEPVMELEIAAASTGERSFTAVWEIITYTITYVAEGAQPVHGSLKTTYTVEDLPLYPLSVYNTTDHFLGWCTDEALTSPVKYIETCSDLTLYASFIAPTEGIVYTDMGSYYEISGYEGEETVLYVPEIYNGKPVSGVTDRAFRDNETLKEIYLPVTLNTIGTEAFYNCDTLTAYNIRLDAFLHTIGTLAFADCDSITTFEAGFLLDTIGDKAFLDADSLSSVTLGMSTSLIGVSAFENCDNITSISITDAVDTIGDRAFYSCSQLSSLTFAEDGILTRIGNEAFTSASALTEITIPASLVTIGDNAFYSATKLSAVTFAEGSKLETIGKQAFRNCKLITTISIPDSVITIDNHAFYSASGLESVSFGEKSKLEFIGDFAFYNCDSITEITVPTSTRSIGAEAFSDSNAIATIIFSGESKLESIGTSAFSNCSKLTEILVPESATVGAWAFYGCINLKTVQLPAADANSPFASYFGGEKYIPTGIKNLTITGGDAIAVASFEKLTALETLSVPSLNGKLCTFFGGDDNSVVPASLTRVEITGSANIVEAAFKDCAKIKTIIFSDNVTSIASGALEGCTALEYIRIATIPSGKGTITDLFAKDFKEDFGKKVPASLATVEINWKQIPAHCFENTYVKNVIINNELKTIGENAFYNCKQLVSVALNQKESELELIDNNAFFGCTALKNFTVTDKLTTIGDYAFSGCIALASIDCSDVSVLATLGTEAFSACSNLVSFTFPANFKNSGDRVFMNCTKLESIVINDAMTHIGESAFEGCKSLKTVTVNQESSLIEFGAYAFRGCASLESIDITNEVKTISANAFEGCSSLAAVNFSEANELLNLGEYAFDGCETLASITLPASVKRVQNGTFKGCSALASVSFGEGSVISAIDESAFEACSALSTVAIPAGVTTISNNAFRNCYALKSVSFANENELSSILAGAFNGCISLETIAIPAGVHTIGDSAFEGCLSLASVNFAEANALKTIGTRAFADCDAMTSFAVPAGVTEIGEYAFYNCQVLKSISFAEGIALAEIPAYAFYDCTALASFTVPACVTVIGDYAFYNAAALESVSFAEGTAIREIGKSAFRNNVKLASFTAPATLESIGEYAFSGCTGLSFVHLTLEIDVIGAYAFRDCSMQIRFTEAFDGFMPIGWDTYWNPEFCPIEWSYVAPAPAPAPAA